MRSIVDRKLSAVVSISGRREIGEHPPETITLKQHRIRSADITHEHCCALPDKRELSAPVHPNLLARCGLGAHVQIALVLENIGKRKMKGLIKRRPYPFACSLVQ